MDVFLSYPIDIDVKRFYAKRWLCIKYLKTTNIFCNAFLTGSFIPAQFLYILKHVFIYNSK